MTQAASLGGVAEAIWQVVVPLLPGFTVEVVPDIDSTNSELMRRARQGLLDPVLLVAEHQHAGRGRLGRGWVDQPGQSLTFSLGLALDPLDWSGLSLAVGVSLAEQLHDDVRLKWPNDLWLQGRKLGGILVETASTGEVGRGARSVVIGVGLNIARPADAAVAAPAPGSPAPMAPAGLAEAIVGETAAQVLQRVVPALVSDVLDFAREGFVAFERRYAARDALRERPVRLSDGREGTALGVSSDGALLLMTAGDGLVRVSSAEVSVRPC